MIKVLNWLNDFAYFRWGLIAFSAFFLLFEVFRRLTPDYKKENVVRASLLGLFITGFFLAFSNRLQLSLSLSVLIGVVVTVSWFSKNGSWRFWSVLEKITPPIYLALAVSQFGYLEMIGSLLTLLSNLYWRNYRNFSWYPSGKSGFIFFADLIVFSLFNLLLDFFQNRLLQFIVWILTLAVGIIGLILLARQEKRPTVVTN